MIQTRDGLPLSTASTAGAAALDDAIDSYLGTRADTPQILRAALEHDPGHLMARCFMGYLTKLAGDSTNAERAAKLYRSLQQEVGDGAGTAWERSHVTALGLWLDDDLDALMAHFEAVLEHFPRDVLSLRMLHYLYFYDGDARRMRDSVGDRLAAYAGHRLEGYIQGMYAFGLEEAGDYAVAERFGRQAVERNPRDLWAVHAVAHVMQMQARTTDGIAWLQGLRPMWDGGNNFRFHLCWHESLFHLADGDYERVLAIYDDEVAPAVADDFYLDLCNAASLLLRLEAAGASVGDRWGVLATQAERHVADTELVFASLHHLMPLLKVGSPAAGELLGSLRRWADRSTTQGRIVRDVAIHVADFLCAVQAGERARAAALFESFRGQLHRIGGSHAQRDLFRIVAAAPSA
jgi:tetratricopeptide (TPR) repeat protein